MFILVVVSLGKSRLVIFVVGLLSLVAAELLYDKGTSLTFFIKVKLQLCISRCVFIYYGSFYRHLVELLKLVQPTVPIIENFEKINQVHGYFFYGLLGVLFLIISYIISWRVTKPFL